jgi:hypothetical protein
VILAALETVSQSLETLAMTFNTFAFDGSSEAQRCTIGPADPNIARDDTMMLGWDFRFPVTESLERPLFTVPVFRETNPLTHEGILEPALGYLARTCALHVYFRETRKPWQRTGDSVVTAAARAEQSIIQRLPLTRAEFRVPDQNGVQRGFSVRLENTFNLDQSSLTMHTVFLFRFTYPNVPSGIFGEKAFKARTIHLVRELGVPEVSSAPFLTLLTLPNHAVHQTLT